MWDNCAYAAKMILAILPVVIASIRTGMAFDRILRIEYERYPTEWEKDGKPAGFSYDPIQTPFKRSSPMDRVFRKWLRTTPEWACHDPDAVRALRHLRSRWKITVACFFLMYFFVWGFLMR